VKVTAAIASIEVVQISLGVAHPSRLAEGTSSSEKEDQLSSVKEASS
jgi:hypothetical protein